MPLYREFELNGASVAVWRITETVDELFSLLPAEYASGVEPLHSEQRRAEWLAVRVLLQRMCGKNAHIEYDGAGKPMLCNAAGFISISHTKGYAVLAHSKSNPIGVDVELLARDVSLAARRFLNEKYLAQVPENNRSAYVRACWCSCEALFKLLGNIGGSYKENVFVKPFVPSSHGIIDVAVKGVPHVDDCDYKAVYVDDNELLVLLVTGK